MVSGEANTGWQRDVAPQNAGTGQHHLTLSAIVTVNKGSLPHAIRTFDREITVQVTCGQRLSGFVGTNWQWLWSRLHPAKKTK